MSEALTTDLLLCLCNTYGIPIGGAKMTGGRYYSPYYASGTDERTEVCRVGTWYSPDQRDEVTVFAIVTSSCDPTDNFIYIESWVVCWIEDMGDWGEYYSSYILPFSALKKYFQRWIKEFKEEQR